MALKAEGLCKNLPLQGLFWKRI